MPVEFHLDESRPDLGNHPCRALEHLGLKALRVDLDQVNRRHALVLASAIE
ncbi:hypothetical protein SIAM614_20650 [Stappia aggregata IAM 12614]|uniref:Uncharacterized protein n=1 Tax=Roseibium aggregatum (strain ATCC 25650 / DSM 13394 / JCM 20685 / NBRC 16684 / NCIMB 2208 / IAM 12614 / B1) TaxID=384765 RepID=A0NYE1_ROSAI|nr:hypothetical protein [Roseibium aggregatum]EAV42137.1 hypothetical protein SIAM614_20650 [Stappia aggregata IAM 12614] [Roseibium aggregatum IAM 12614]